MMIVGLINILNGHSTLPFCDSIYLEFFTELPVHDIIETCPSFLEFPSSLGGAEACNALHTKAICTRVFLPVAGEFIANTHKVSIAKSQIAFTTRNSQEISSRTTISGSIRIFNSNVI